MKQGVELWLKFIKVLEKAKWRLRDPSELKASVERFFKYVYYSSTRSIRRKLNSPFVKADKKILIVHCCYHKTGTVWFQNFLREIGGEYGLRFQNGLLEDLKVDTDIFLEDHSRLDPSQLPEFRGTHIIRDPRDMTVSSYFFHLWSAEQHLREPSEEYLGKSYQEHLKGLSKHEGLVLEIQRNMIVNFKPMMEWDYERREFLELKYEDVMSNQQEEFQKIFRHYGFTEEAINKSLKIVEIHSFKQVTKRSIGETKEKSHLRSGEAGQWRLHFDERTKSDFKRITGDLLYKLGYEKDSNW